MRLFLLKRKMFTAAACLLAACAMFYIVNHPAVVGAAAATRQLPIYCVQRDQKMVSISFDAAWGNSDNSIFIFHTNSLLFTDVDNYFHRCLAVIINILVCLQIIFKSKCL